MLQYYPTVFSNNEFGSVTINTYTMTLGSTTNPSFLSGKLNGGQIAGIVVGSVVGWIVAMLIGVCITVAAIKRAMRSQRSVRAAEGSSPGVMTPGGSSMFRGFRRKQNPQSVPLASAAF